MATQTLFITQNTDFALELQLLNDDSTVINIANYAFGGVVKPNPWSYANVPLTIIVTDAANGNIVVSLNAATTGNMAYGTWMYSLSQYSPANLTLQLLNGDLIVNPNPQIVQPSPVLPPRTYTDYFLCEFIGQTKFFLSYIPANTSNVTIVYNAVVQPNSNTIYVLTSNELVFANGCNVGDQIQASEIVYSY